MGFASHYLNRNAGLQPLIREAPSNKPTYIVVIPAFCEPQLCDTLTSLWTCSRPQGHVEVIIIVNAGEHHSDEIVEENKATINTARNWIDQHYDPAFRFFVISRLKMPEKYAGVGLARKTGMDEALMRFSQAGMPKGYILSLDADSICDMNYFTAIEKEVTSGRKIYGFNVYFEHQLTGNQFPQHVYRGIAEYELHLRYHKAFLRYTGFPHAYHTVGSCFGVMADIYARQGGMNRRKAGEDFYFLQKVIPLGNFIEINSTRVVPSSRVSDRAPFGTGAALSRYLHNPEFTLTTYAPESYMNIRSFIREVQNLYKADADTINGVISSMHSSLQQYLNDVNVLQAIEEVNSNCNSYPAFANRFFRWFDAFRIIKYLNYARKKEHANIPVSEAAIKLLQIMKIPARGISDNAFKLLEIYRMLDKGKYPDRN